MIPLRILTPEVESRLLVATDPFESEIILGVDQDRLNQHAQKLGRETLELTHWEPAPIGENVTIYGNPRPVLGTEIVQSDLKVIRVGIHTNEINRRSKDGNGTIEETAYNLHLAVMQGLWEAHRGVAKFKSGPGSTRDAWNRATYLWFHKNLGRPTLAPMKEPSPN